MFCRVCGDPLPETAAVCSSCGIPCLADDPSPDPLDPPHQDPTPFEQPARSTVPQLLLGNDRPGYPSQPERANEPSWPGRQTLPRRRPAWLVPGLSATFILVVAIVATAISWSANRSNLGSSPSSLTSTTAPSAPESALTPSTATSTPTTSAPQPPRSAVLVDETFSAGKLPRGWTPARGDWKITNGRLQSTTGDARARIAFGPRKVPTNYRIDTMVRFVEVADARRWLNIGLDYHVDQDWGALFVARSDTTAANGLELAQRRRSHDPYRSDPVHSAPAAIGVGEDHWLSVEVRGTHVKVVMDGQQVFTADNLSRTGGQLGFVINDGTTQFDNVKVTRLDA